MRVAKRDAIKARLHELGVRTGIHYWPAAHRHLPFANGRVRDRSTYASSLRLDQAVGWSQEELSLPMFPELTRDEVLAVVSAMATALEEETA